MQMTRIKSLIRLASLALAGFGLLLLAACGDTDEDITPPEIIVTSPASIPSPTSNTYPATTPLTVTGTVDDPHATVEIAATPPEILEDFVAAPDWSFTVQDLVEGANTVSITASDESGNTNTANITIVVDTTPPMLLFGPVSTVTPPVSTLTIGGVAKTDSTVVLSGAAATPVSPPTFDTYTWQFDLFGLAPGPNILTADATDTLGNTNSRSLTVTFDSNANAIAIDDLNPVVTSASQSLTGTMAAGVVPAVAVNPSSTTAVIDAVDATHWKATFTGLHEGSNAITITDTAGPGTAAVDLVLNKKPPQVSSKLPTGSSVPVDSEISATFSESVMGVDETSFLLKDAGGTSLPGTVTYDDAAKTATFVPVPALAGGTKYTATLTIKVADLAGTKLSQNFSWSFTTAP